MTLITNYQKLIEIIETIELKSEALVSLRAQIKNFEAENISQCLTDLAYCLLNNFELNNIIILFKPILIELVKRSLGN
jgi:hypothetical protein